jgi:hypothetical protein
MNDRCFVPVPKQKEEIHLVLSDTCDTILSEWPGNDHREKKGGITMAGKITIFGKAG